MKTYLFIIVFCGLSLVAKGQIPILDGSGFNEDGKANGMAYLRWTPQNGQIYEIQKYQKNNDSWRRLGSSETGYFVDSAYVCADSLAYRLHLGSDFSNSIRLWVEDRTAPDAVDFVSIQVENFNQWTVLRWDSCKTPDLLGYVIGTGMLLENLDTVKGRAYTTYVDSLKPINSNRVYRVMSIDQCYNRSVFLQDRTIFTSQLSYIACADSIRLDWSPLVNMISKVDEFEIYAQYKKEVPLLIGKVFGNQSFFYFPVFTQTGEYKVYVSAVDTQKYICAHSAYDSIFIEFAELPTTFEIINVDVLPRGKVEITMDISADGLFDYFIIYREDAFNGLREVARVKYKDKNLVKWIDEDGYPEFSSSTYYACLWDTCGRMREQTNRFTTLFFKFENLQDQNATFLWNGQNNWKEGVQSYELIQRNTRTQVETKLASFDFENILEYKEKVFIASLQEMLESEYFVQAFSTSIPPLESRSNRVRLNKDGEITFYIPNGFAPKGGKSKGFGPIGVFLEDDQLEMRIFDRNGTLLFHSRSFSAYWDGMYKGDYVAFGSYVYQIKISRNGGLYRIENGTVTIVY